MFYSFSSNFPRGLALTLVWTSMGRNNQYSDVLFKLHCTCSFRCIELNGAWSTAAAISSPPNRQPLIINCQSHPYYHRNWTLWTELILTARQARRIDRRRDDHWIRNWPSARMLPQMMTHQHITVLDNTAFIAFCPALTLGRQEAIHHPFSGGAPDGPDPSYWTCCCE